MVSQLKYSPAPVAHFESRWVGVCVRSLVLFVFLVPVCVYLLPKLLIGFRKKDLKSHILYGRIWGI